jgi:gamma-glutamyl hercynylcysteine S-oxide synthase
MRCHRCAVIRFPRRVPAGAGVTMSTFTGRALARSSETPRLRRSILSADRANFDASCRDIVSSAFERIKYDSRRIDTTYAASRRRSNPSPDETSSLEAIVACRGDARHSVAVNTNELLIADLVDTRARLISLVADLSDDELCVPKLGILNPPVWEIGHVAWFQEHWTLRHLDRCASLREDADRLWDSAAVAHDLRWDLPLPTRSETLAYMERVLEAVVRRLDSRTADEREAYFLRLVTFHEDMHGEALVYTRQTLGLPPPACASSDSLGGGALPGDVEIPGGTFQLGASRDLPFVFDNEKWAHSVEIAPFAIARAPVTQADLAEFVEAGGYEHDRWWREEGLAWRATARARHPLYWERDANGRWFRRHFDRLVLLEEHKPAIHVNWFEADAFCNFKNRRLPTEAEWELAASGPIARERSRKPLFPWGDETPDRSRTELDLWSSTCADVGAHARGDNAFGCRQMIGNVWEWTASDFRPYPGFAADPYKEYSEPWFGTHKVLRGGCYATRSRLIRNTWRNFYTPDRRDVLAGFRTCAR